MQRKDIYLVGSLVGFVLLIFYPVFYSDYLFMDEAFQIWNYKSVPGFYMFIDQGRWFTEILETWLFHFVHTIADVKYLRILSLLGWCACLPVWYTVIKRVIGDVPQYKHLPFFTCLYLVTSLPFIVSLQWATCMQFFIAHTSGLLSGAILLQSMRFDNNRIRISPVAVLAASTLSIVSLFTYQSAFGCYLIPFLLHFISVKTVKKEKIYLTGLSFYFIGYVVYFGLYKLSLLVNHIPHDPRTTIHIDVVDKIKFFLARPLERSFRFTVLTNEDSHISKVYYALMLCILTIAAFVRFGKQNRMQAVKYLAATGFIFLISYFPSLVVKENFASNRTLLALDLCVFIICLEMVLYFIKNKTVLQVAGFMAAAVFILSARYNYREEFVHPLQQETAALKAYIQQHYHNGIKTINFIRPSEYFIAEKYQVNKSMDEFGVASTCWPWVPEPFTRHMVYEVTGNRKTAADLQIKQWPDKESYIRSGETSPDALLIDVPAIMSSVQP
jgi:hypothetical protein